jgi:outer membrane protein assembly factor BamA
MRIPSALIIGIAACTATLCLAQAPVYTPRTIQFLGAPEYTREELLSAAQLKPGDQLTVAEMGEHAKTLMSTGMFSKLTYNFDGQDLIYQLAPSPDLLPIRITNLPLKAGGELDAKLHTQIPLYHGKVPGDGSVNDDVRAALEKMLAEEGLKASVQAVAAAGLGSAKEAAINYFIADPPVVVGPIAVVGAPAAIDAGAQQILAHLTGSAYDAEGTPSQMATYLDNYYHDRGYLEATVRASPKGAAVAAADSIRIPFEINLAPGILYKLGNIRLAPELLLKQVDFDKQARLRPGDIADQQHVQENWEYVARQYHNHGYMQPKVEPTPSYDHASQTVSYAVTVTPGPLYAMGKLTVENVSDDLRAAILAAWKIPPGTVFNEGAVRSFFATQGVNPALERVLASAAVHYTQTLNDDTHTVDLVVKFSQKHY